MDSAEQDYIKKAKDGDRDAFVWLCEKYQPIVYSLQRKYYLKDFEQDDWLQESRIVCYQTVNTYRFDQGLTFGFFYKMNLQRHVFSLLRRQEALKRRIDRTVTSLDEKLEYQGEFFYTREDPQALTSFQHVTVREHLATFHTQLSFFEREVFANYLIGKELNEISSELRCPETKVKSGLDRAKRKFKNYMT
ncbi:sigma-70 family RNA polymerase sigma factor [Vagococcus acidifermentans]|uniref:RNA polymerase sigma factor SigS n=1 Tax=Vagococcus acidifermentans TaxID=564710 RepID=A0A430APF1_9ENTE|nr:sigma-70 family RNA polymerase sigma factor [Vagococcus acidifermentans]RSU09767.1 hypothetical protein CBF27_11830 [Vagococcus acidifermentans]